MHFAKTYSQLLLTLSPELRESAIEYRQLKRLVKQIVDELDSLGLTPAVLHRLLGQGVAAVPVSGCGAEAEVNLDSEHHPTVTYEIATESASFEPRLRISFGHKTKVSDHVVSPSSEEARHILDVACEGYIQPQGPHAETEPPPLQNVLEQIHDGYDLVIPLRSETAFICLLTSALSSLSGHFSKLHDDFTTTLVALAASISSNARPVSSSAPHTFSAYILSAHNVMSVRPGTGGKSDLYFWREVFQQYVNAEIFEGIAEANRGDRSVQEAENRLALFRNRVAETEKSLKFAGSKEALKVFFSLNAFILDVKKFQLATAEATRKILKKHTKRTALPIPSHLLSGTGNTDSSEIVLSRENPVPLQKLLIQAIGEILLPVVPHIDDYSCLICTSIAFKPIRLDCGHLFCVRCLVKLQKRGRGDCPLCRAPTVLKANAANVDYALLNFMSDWFPVESRAKLQANEREVAEEQLRDLGISPDSGCIVM
ncbi:hypothetical protein ID866_8243 [Astraeus odoratus]|nr:hypothetical protein ID866_8243 [Astraeus odoratus]